jgi:hypothetical protein
VGIKPRKLVQIQDNQEKQENKKTRKQGDKETWLKKR